MSEQSTGKYQSDSHVGELEKTTLKSRAHTVRVSGSMSDDETDRTDYDYLARVTDKEIDEAIKNDPDSITLDDVDMSALRVVDPHDRKMVSIRMENDVLTWYKENYTPYQTQINAVLKAFKEAQQAAKNSLGKETSHSLDQVQRTDIQEGLNSGPSIPLDAEAIKARGKKRLAKQQRDT